ncbi:MAG: hypothetical protein LQ352_003280 [Teloschistes flavicans]|nr:MAG: hypothetical protein LQ352_003280 [Teloschistes flavicans]
MIREGFIFHEFPIYQELGYDFNFTNWAQLVKIIEDGFAQYKYIKHKYHLLSQQLSTLAETTRNADVTQQPSIALMQHHFINLTRKCHDYKNALAHMIHAAIIQYYLLQLDIVDFYRFGRFATEPWIWTQSIFKNHQTLRFKHSTRDEPRPNFWRIYEDWPDRVEDERGILWYRATSARLRAEAESIRQ